MLDTIRSCIEQQKDRILTFGNTLLNHPELGFKETFSSLYIERSYREMGLEVESGYACTALKAHLPTCNHGLRVCLLSELDAVVSPLNPHACSTGEAHACGHSSQSTQVYAAILALKEISDQLDGDVFITAVPAEEFLDIQARLAMREQGKITYLSGKQELIHLGFFDEMDIIIMIHSEPNHPSYDVFIGGGSLGFVAKNIRFMGQEAHGARPFNGINALQAASLALAGINANRETFSEEEHLRIHPIITKGGDVVNTVPSDVRMETYVRGGSQVAIKKGCRIVDRCVHAASLMMGGSAEIETIPGYLPLRQDAKLSELFAQCAEQVAGIKTVVRGRDMIGSTDMGDLSQLKCCIQPTMGGFVGEAHSKEFDLVDAWNSYLLGGQLLALMVYELLRDGAKQGNRIHASFVPSMDKKAYLAYLNAQGEK
ncbi:amidohydrolase [uncultured Sphaerochaeta sp.]|jgi:amidohydrolase|uniref:amidohydrolase n=1 Tax=uncultured Sphaerochaeta sp. TaxID=886478 RepID=UPI002A0A5976|nr:amidohydrolase [uncultured Sphaerochaeta sp.]